VGGLFRGIVADLLSRPRLGLTAEATEREHKDESLAPAVGLRLKNRRRRSSAEDVDVNVKFYRRVSDDPAETSLERNVHSSLPWQEHVGIPGLHRRATRSIELLYIDESEPDNPKAVLNVRRRDQCIFKLLAPATKIQPGDEVRCSVDIRLGLAARYMREREYTVRVNYGSGAVTPRERVKADIVSVKPADARAAFDPRVARLVAAGLAVSLGVAVAGAVSALVGSRGGGPPCVAHDRSAASGRDRTVRQIHISRRVPQLVRRIPVGMAPDAVVVSGGRVWVGSHKGIDVIDPRHPARRPLRIPSEAVYALAVSRDRIWATLRNAGVLISIDRHTRKIVPPRVHFGSASADVTVGGDAVWVNNFGDAYEGNVTRIDPCSGRMRRVPVGGNASAVKFAYGYLWVSLENMGQVVQVDPVRRTVVDRIKGLADPQDIAGGHHQLWVDEVTSMHVARIDPRKPNGQKLIGRLDGGPEPGGLAVGGGAVWQALYGASKLRKILVPDHGRPEVTETRAGLLSPTDVALGFERLWLPDNGRSTVTVLRP
jgi:streptogramin lyase